MKVNYTLPGLLPEQATAPGAEAGPAEEPFSAKLGRLRAPEATDWRALLRLDIPPAGAAGFGPPPVPQGIESRDVASQRAWWRASLERHARHADAEAPVQRMLGMLMESQGQEDEIFARHFAESGN